MSRADIVVVDDNPANLQVIRAILEDAGYEVRPAISGTVALTAVEAKIPDLILLDMEMPEMSGIEVCTELQSDKRYADIPVIFISALTGQREKLGAFQAGGVDYITKPFEAEEVLARVRLHLRLHRLTARLLAANAESQVTLEHLTQAQAQLVESEKMAALGGLVAGIAHEVNTPLGVAITAVTTMLNETTEYQGLPTESQTPSHLVEVLDLVVDCATLTMANLRRADSLIDSFKRVAVDRGRAEPQPFLVVPYIEEIIAVLGPHLRRSGHQVVVEGDPQLQLFSDPGSFSQVLTNFTMNSIHHAYEAGQRGGQIRVSVTAGHNQAVITYSDDGRGIPAQDRTRVFEPFYTTARGVGRTGLGLHVVYNVVTQILDGEVECDNAANGGARFTVRIPM